MSVGLGDVDVVDLEDEATEPLVVHIPTRSRPMCWGCGRSVWSKGTTAVRFVDLSAFGVRCGSFAGVQTCGAVGVTQVAFAWRKWRWRAASGVVVAPAAGCGVASFTETNDEIAPVRSALTSRAGRWATTAVDRDAPAVRDVADELGCD